jgi:hypothetical protein
METLERGNTGLKSLKMAIVLLAFSPGAALAETCLNDARQLGDTYGLAIDPPDAPSKDQPRAPSSRDLAQSGADRETQCNPY